jgi:protein tyrosine phosphatase domain-containing protein 1
MDCFVQRKLRVLVHCHAGMGRTAIICASYLVYSGKAQTGEEAIEIVQRERPGTLRNKLTAKNAAMSIIEFGK